MNAPLAAAAEPAGPPADTPAYDNGQGLDNPRNPNYEPPSTGGTSSGTGGHEHNGAIEPAGTGEAVEPSTSPSPSPSPIPSPSPSPDEEVVGEKVSAWWALGSLILLILLVLIGGYAVYQRKEAQKMRSSAFKVFKQLLRID